MVLPRLYFPCAAQPNMASATPSIQSFFPKIASPSALQTTPCTAIANGCASQEIEGTISPEDDSKWKPPADYDLWDIAALLPGLSRVAVTGRIVNLHDQGAIDKMPRTAKGCLKLIIKDNTGLVTVCIARDWVECLFLHKFIHSKMNHSSWSSS